MTALGTGASGFVGSAVLRHLVAQGEQVRVLMRDASNRGNIAGIECEVVTGDLTDAQSLTRAVKGCDVVFHVAADYRLWVADPAVMYRANVDGTRNLLRAAAEAGAGRIVYTSSVAAIGYEANGSPGSETTVATIDDMIGHYKRSKFLAELEAMRLAADEGVPVVTVNPAAPFGPRDIKPTPPGRIVVEFARGRMPAYVDTGLNVVHVDDVAAGHLLAWRKGNIGERYILGGDNMTLREILGVIAGHLGRPAPRIRLPRLPLFPIAWGAELASRLFGGEPMVTAEALRMAKKRMYFSSRKAIDGLGYAPRPGKVALTDAADWFRDNGYFD
ncbi:MAG: NAD-dependent epimerase/dehydratase family protein [Rhodospirillales bacterium]|nr:NAD-dependent epimerase/dehydratase family protein [Rhodospirillales bacterium]